MGPVVQNSRRRVGRDLLCALLVALSGLTMAEAQQPRTPPKAPAPKVSPPTWVQPAKSRAVDLEECWEKNGVVYRSDKSGKIIEQKKQVDCTFADWDSPAYVKWVCQATPPGSKTKFTIFAQPTQCTNGALCADDACRAIKPDDCWVLNGTVVATDAKGKITAKKKVMECSSPDWVSAKYLAASCKAVTKTKKQIVLQTPSCPEGQLCAANSCQPAPITCSDADHTGPTTLFTPPNGSGLPSPTIPQDQTQIFTPSYVKVQQGQTTTKTMADGCKGPALREMVCLSSVKGFEEVSVKCPADHACKTKPVPGPGGELLIAGYCAQACPFGDMCPNEPGCGECTTITYPDPCTPLDTTKSYPNATIVNDPTWGPHLHTCVDQDTFQHHLCENGKAAYPTTNCPPGKLCKDGLCDGQSGPEPDPNAPKACVDLDPSPADTNPPPGQFKAQGTNGDIHACGQILLNGSLANAANDACATKKMVKQAKCAGDDFTFAPDTCTFSADGKPEECKTGICKPIIQACACTYEPPNLATKTPGKLTGTDKFGDFINHPVQCNAAVPAGDAFGIEDQCDPSDPHLILKTSCDEGSSLCYQGPTAQSCGQGMVCKDNLCQPENAATCSGPAAGTALDKFTKMTVSGTDQTGVPFTDVPDECVTIGSQVQQVWCDTAEVEGYEQGPPEDCVLDLCNTLPNLTECMKHLCKDGACVTCVDSDPDDLQNTVGYAADLTQSESDYCNTEGKLVQVTCLDGKQTTKPPLPCTVGVCLNDKCVVPPDLCAGKDLNHPTNKCLVGTCDPTTGIVGNYVTKPIPDDGDLCTNEQCDPATGATKNIQKDIDDGDACTVDSCEQTTGIVTNVKNLTLPGCDPCQGKNLVNPNNKCEIGTCDPQTGVVSNFVAMPIPGDGDKCTINGCDPATGLPTFTKDPAIDDKILCTIDTCSPSTGSITHTNDPTIPGCNPCSVKDLANPNNKCEIGTCNPQTGEVSNYKPKPIQDDGDACTIDGCDPITGQPTHVKDPSKPECAPKGEIAEIACNNGTVASWAPLGVKDPYGHLQGQLLSKVVSVNSSTHFALSIPDLDQASGIKTMNMFRYDGPTQAWTPYVPTLPPTTGITLFNDLVASEGTLWLVVYKKFTTGELSRTLYQSTDAGKSWQSAGLNIAADYNTRLFASHGTLYAIHAFKSHNTVFYFKGVDNWVPLAFGPPASNNAPLYITAIIPHTEVTYLFSADGPTWLHTSDDTKWLEQGSVPLSGDVVTAAASFQGNLYASTNGGKVWKSTNGGNGWTEMSVGLKAGEPVTSLAVHQEKLYAASTFGVYQWDDKNSAWAIFKVTLGPCPNSPVDTGSITLHSDDSQLIATTNCAGVHGYGCPLNAQCPEGEILRLDPLGAGDPYGNLGEGHHPFAMPYATKLMASGQDLFRFQPSSQSWQKLPFNGLGVAPSSVKAKEVVTIGETVLVKATFSDGSAWMIRSTNGGQTWQKLYQISAHNLTVSGDRILGTFDGFLGLKDSVVVSAPPYDQWIALQGIGNVQAIHVNGTQAYMITGAGQVYELSIDNIVKKIAPQATLLGQVPIDENTGLVRALYRHQGEFFVATKGQGLWRSSDGGKNWQTANNGLSGIYGYAFAEFQGQLYVGRTKTLHRWNPDTTAWELIASYSGPAPGEMEYLQGTPEALYAGVHAAGMYQLHCGPPPIAKSCEDLDLKEEDFTVKVIDAGSGFACAVVDLPETKGTVWCWGLNNHGQLGIPTKEKSESTIPVQVPYIDSAKTLATGWNHACAALTDNSLRCWGLEGKDGLGLWAMDPYGNPKPASEFPAMGLGTVQALSAGKEFTCALLGGGEVACWGANGFEQLGLTGDLAKKINKSKEPVSANIIPQAVTQIVSGFAHSCAITNNTRVYCWGGWSALSQDPDGGPGDTDSGGYVVTPLGDIVEGVNAVDSFHYRSCVLTGSAPTGLSNLSCWGMWQKATGEGQVPMTMMAAGQKLTCGHQPNMATQCWGTFWKPKVNTNGYDAITVSPEKAPTVYMGSLTDIVVGTAPTNNHDRVYFLDSSQKLHYWESSMISPSDPYSPLPAVDFNFCPTDLP